MLAIVEAVKHFRPYIFGRHFTVLTNHSALSKCLKTSNPSSRLTRWILNLQEYNFSIDWRPGHLNKVADAFSRLPTFDELVHECNFLTIFSVDNNTNSDPLTVSMKEIAEAQQKDTKFAPCFAYLQKNELPEDTKICSEVVTWCRFMAVRDDVFFHFQNLAHPSRRSCLIQQIVVPFSLRRRIFTNNSFLRFCLSEFPLPLPSLLAMCSINLNSTL